MQLIEVDHGGAAMADQVVPEWTRPYCFVIMSFGDNPALQDHYELGIRPTVQELGFECIRADEVEHNRKITETIVGLLRNAHFVIADLTDEKPNCYYELGFAHALGKNVIHTINKETAIHFDVKDYNFIIYSRVQELAVRLRQRIQATVESKAADSLSVIADAIDRYSKFTKDHKQRLLRDRVTEYPVQSYNEKTMLPSPFNLALKFHVKEGLVAYSDPVQLQKSDGAVYIVEQKHRGWGRYSSEANFRGLIQRAEDIDLLLKKIDFAYDNHKAEAEQQRRRQGDP